MSLKPGQPAPLFKLYSSSKQLVSLEDYRGQKVVLLFFPLVFSSTCTKEMCEVRDNITFYNTHKAVVLGVSVDSLYAQHAFRTHYNLPFELLADFNKEVSRAYEAVHEQFGYGMREVSKRAAFVIDAEGILRYVEVLENPGLLPDFDTINELLDQI